MPKLSDDEKRRRRLERVKTQWGEATENERGLQVLNWHIFAKETPAQMALELLKRPTVLVADNVEICVVMPIEDYFAHVNSNPKGEMVRVHGKLFREI